MKDIPYVAKGLFAHTGCTTHASGTVRAMDVDDAQFIIICALRKLFNFPNLQWSVVLKKETQS